MKFTDIFIRRPVLASVVSLLILVLGLRALGTLQILQYPQTQNAVVTLQGSVDSETLRQRAVTIAGSLSGVRQVVDKLAVKS